MRVTLPAGCPLLRGCGTLGTVPELSGVDCEGDGRGFQILNYRDVTVSQAPTPRMEPVSPCAFPLLEWNCELKQTPLSCVCWDFTSQCVCSACLCSRTGHRLRVVMEPYTHVCEIRASAEHLYSYVLIYRVKFPRKPVCQEVLKYLSSELCGREERADTWRQLSWDITSVPFGAFS